MAEQEEPQMFAVEPKADCPHIARSVAPVLNFELTDPCTDCGHAGENWVCLQCSKVFCSRYVNEHMVQHFGQEKHPVVFSFSDLSFWCYCCDSYVKSPILAPIFNAAHKAKFGAATTGHQPMDTLAEELEESEGASAAAPSEATASASASASAADGDAPEMFAVHPKTNCPHVFEHIAAKLEFELDDPCQSCGNTSENWLCLECSEVFCSRYVEGHMVAHNDASSHPIALSFSDLSVWCYSCDSYIKHRVLTPILSAIHQAKFGTPLPAAGGVGADGQPVGARLGVPEDTTEFHDSEDVVVQRAKELADLIRHSKHLVVYTGAGISTSAKIPDYRGPNGVWTLQAQGREAKMDITLEQAVPTPTHMALKSLLDHGLLKFVVSTNVDGLHRRSGIPADCISEVHGNVYREYCQKCGREYLRSKNTTRNGPGHLTGRSCEQPGCNGALQDSIINFGESLPENELKSAIANSEQCDVALVLGSSMRVSPACEFPFMSQQPNATVAICNLQATPKDGRATWRCFCETDRLMQLVMQELGIPIPEPDEETLTANVPIKAAVAGDGATAGHASAAAAAAAAGGQPAEPCAAEGCDNQGAKRCSRCQTVQYCSKQTSHWPSHKAQCSKPQSRPAQALNKEQQMLAQLFKYKLRDAESLVPESSPLITAIRQRALDGDALSPVCALQAGDEIHRITQDKLFKRVPWDCDAEQRAVASVVGMAIGDALGAPVEFEPVFYGDERDGIVGLGPRAMRSPPVTGMGKHAQGAFRLKPGQWTDDASMGLCLADSLLHKPEFDPLDLMLRFEAWWHGGYNNAFGSDDQRPHKGSVGLGGNISQGLRMFLFRGAAYTPAGDRFTSGNGSLMRHAPVSVAFHDNINKAMQAARQQSLTTHQGEEAAEANRLLSRILVTAIHGDGTKETVLEDMSDFESSEPSVVCLARSQAEPGGDPDRNWNWKDPNFMYSVKRSRQQPGYVGSYAMDNLAMSLHCVWTTNSFRDAVLKVVNFRGDADSVGSVTAQIAGAIYGADTIPREWIECVQRWDRQGTIAARAARLFHKKYLN